MLTARSPAPQAGDHTILLVEDDDAFRKLMRLVLDDCGYTVLEGHDAEAAFDSAARHDGPIHLLITDVVMPGMNGRELAEHMLASYDGLKVLFVSGFVDDARLESCLEPRRVELMKKPFSLEEMSRRVATLLTQVPVRDEAGA